MCLSNLRDATLIRACIRIILCNTYIIVCNRAIISLIVGPFINKIMSRYTYSNRKGYRKTI